MTQAYEQPQVQHSEEASAQAPQYHPQEPKVLTVAGQELTIFVEWPPLRECILRDIEAAKTRIWIETYIFFNDEGGKRIAEALKAKAREGLDVRVMYDPAGSVSTPKAFFHDMAAAGIKVHAFHSLTEVILRGAPLSLLNRRNHRKLLVVDNTAGYFGGMNIVDNTMPDNVRVTKDKLPTSAGWRDVHIRLVGDMQAQLAESFDRSWRRAHHEHIPLRPRKYRRAQLDASDESGESGESIRFFDSGPGFKFSRVGRVYTRLLMAARRSVYLSMAYFIPVGGPRRALLSARRRGVRVRIIVPGKSDVKTVQRATAYLYDKLIHRGFRIYERHSRMLHSKLMVIDDQWATVGSANFDPRSFYINLEFVAVIRSKRFAAIMTDICRYEMNRSRHITMRDCDAIPWYRKLVNMFSWSLRWWL